MKKTKKILPLILLPLLLTGCGERPDADSSVADTGSVNTPASNESVSDTASSVIAGGEDSTSSAAGTTSSSSKNRTVLRQNQIEEVAGEDYTASVSLSANGKSLFDYISKHGDGMAKYQSYDTDGTTLVDLINLYKGSNGNMCAVPTPDKHNEITESDSGEKWFLDNQFGELDAFSFAYITPDDGDDDGYYYFGIAEDMIDDEATADAIEAVLEQEVKFISELRQFSVDETFNDFMIYTDGSKIVGYKGSFDGSYSYYGYSYDMTIDFDVSLSRVGTTGLNAADFVSAPYAVPAGQEANYTALSTAIASMKAATSYKYNTSLAVSNQTIYTDETYVNANGIFIKYEEINDEGTMDTAYNGLKVRADGNLDVYSGTAPDALTATKSVTYTLADYLPDFDTAAEIFDFNASKSTADSYVFDLKADFADDALTEICYDYYASTGYKDYADSISLVVTSAGVLDKVVMTLTDSYGYVYDLTVDYDAFSGDVPATIADFTSYSEFVMPTSFAEITLSNATDTIVTVQDGINDAFGTCTVPFFLNASLYNLLDEVDYYPEDDQGGAVIVFVFPANSIDVDTVANAMTAVGFSLTYDSSYGSWDGTFTSGSVSFNVSVWDYYGYYTFVSFYVD